MTFARRQQGKSNAAQAGRQAVAVKRAAAARTGAAADGGAKGDRVATAAKPAEPETADEAAAKIKKTAPFEAEADIGAWATAKEAAEMTSSHEGSAEAAVGALRAAEAAAAALVALKTPHPGCSMRQRRRLSWRHGTPTASWKISTPTRCSGS